MTIEMEFGARSDVGCVRENNEDSFRLAPELNLFVLSDGMGGLASGEIASRLSVDTVVKHCSDAAANPSLQLVGQRIDGVSEASNRLAGAIRLANQAVHEVAKQNGNGGRMGATLVAARIDGERMSIAHVGDSRIYRLRGGDFEQLTRDHSFVADQMLRGRMTPEEASSSALQSVLIRAIGIEPEVDVDVNEELLMDGDTLLLCSDGLTRELSDQQIGAVLGETEDAQEAADSLVDLAKQAGGGDNVTVIVLRCAPRPLGALARIGRWFRHSS
ncbi:MAG TPA: protein phosphatase 2C domain-containing protein [Candidatus Acidoferrales bacterium]|jgi:protein phosphatase|nr:protein phosphatase 2C domain-containing protein [Candidatus Acidoferrales bacterium]